MSKLGRDRSQELIERSSSETLRKDAARGGVVTLASQGAQFVLQLGSTAIMARLLEIEDFGVFAVALTFTMVLARFRDAGLRTANVQAQALTNGQATSLLMINAGIGLVFALAIAALAPAVAAAYSQPELTPVFLILSASFFVGSLGVQFNGILHRRMQLTALASIEVAALAVSIAAGVASALAGAGVLALAVMQLARQVSITLGSIVLARWAPTRPAPMRDVKGMVGFGFSLALSGGVNNSAPVAIVLSWVSSTLRRRACTPRRSHSQRSRSKKSPPPSVGWRCQASASSSNARTPTATRTAVSSPASSCWRRR